MEGVHKPKPQPAQKCGAADRHSIHDKICRAASLGSNTSSRCCCACCGGRVPRCCGGSPGEATEI